MLKPNGIETIDFEKLLAISNNCSWQLNAEGHFISIHQTIESLSGYAVAELVGRPFIDFISPAEKAIFLTSFHRREIITHLSITFQHKQQQYLAFEINALPIFIDQQWQGYGGIFINISHYKIVEKNLADAQRIAHLGSWELNLMTHELFWSDEIYRILGKERDSLTASYENFIRVIHPDDVAMVQQEMQAALVKKTYNVQHRVLQANGKIGILHERGEVIFDENNQPIRMIGTAQNITELKEAQQKIEQLVNYDFLTELPNRSMFIKQGEHSLNLAKHNKETCALFYLGLDRFKLINESLGHEAGNTLLQKVAQRVAEFLQESDSLARVGGDEFAVLKMNISHADSAAFFAQQVIDQFSVPFTLQAQEVVIGVSIGITLCPVDNRNVTELCKEAQTAMHRAKSNGGNMYQFYSLAMTEQVKHRLSLEAELRQALERGEFLLYYQAKVTPKTGKITGAEALIRWQHPQKGLLSPAHFVSVLEDTGLIVPVGEWALHELCRQYALWNQQSLGEITLALNLSIKQFVDSQLCQKVQATLKKFNHSASFLELEITESMLMGDFDSASLTLQTLHALGIRLAIDDFGTGYSSLAYLKWLPISTLKIDRSFVTGLPHNRQDKAIVEVILKLAQALQQKVVVEGVENPAQLNFLVAQGCDCIQGYYYSKPVSGEQFTRLLQENHHLLKRVTCAL
jgi:diguanylate cyclase (GGDEF)-like protein/PAS domain S-box-containing protein